MKALFAAVLICSSISAFSQSGSVGTLENIQGVVSVSSNGVVTNATASTSLSNGSVVLNSGNGSSVIRLSNGCTIELKASQFVTVNAASSCVDLLASVQTVGVPMVAGGAPAMSPFLIAGGVLGGALIIKNVTKSKASGS